MQSEYTAIMRELVRFRSEFNECHSLRSKFLMTRSICTDINGMLDQNNSTLQSDDDMLRNFIQKKQRLAYRRQQTSVRIKDGQDQILKRQSQVFVVASRVKNSTILRNNSLLMPGNQLKQEQLTGSMTLKSLKKLNKINKPLHGVKCKKISGISCFIQFKTSVYEKNCQLKIFSRLRPGYKTYTLTDIDPETFEIDTEIEKLQFSIFGNPVDTKSRD